ncbi:MAG: hypothetical protein AAGF66_04355 [Cyanobacteria bacterium P01_H01_bin.119]
MMFQTDQPDAIASTLSADQASDAAADSREPIRHILLGSLTGVRAEILNLHKRGHSDPNDWSKPLPTGRPGEVMAILTKFLVRSQ